MKDDLPQDDFERIIALLKKPEFQKLAGMVDYLIVFENGKHKETVRINR